MKNCLFLESAEWIFKLKNWRLRRTKALKTPCWSEPHSTVNRVVAGSSPARGTKKTDHAFARSCFFTWRARNELQEARRMCADWEKAPVELSIVEKRARQGEPPKATLNAWLSFCPKPLLRLGFGHFHLFGYRLKRVWFCLHLPLKIMAKKQILTTGWPHQSQIAKFLTELPLFHLLHKSEVVGLIITYHSESLQH